MHSRSLLVFAVLSALLGSIAWAHLYFIDRLVHGPQLPEPWNTVAALGIAVMGVLILANPMLENFFGPGIGRILGWPAYIWFGSCMYLLFALWASDLVLIVTGLRGVEVERTRALVVLAVTTIIIGVGLRSALRPTPYKRVEVVLTGWPRALDGYRIVQITDIHIGSILRKRFAERLVARCNALQPDLTAVTGDLVDGTVERLRDAVAPFADLRAHDGVYFVTGNHDYFSNADSWTQHVTSLGIEVLRNRRVRITRDGAAFEIAGVDDISSRRMDSKHRFDLDAALAGWNGETPLVLLAHDPRTFELAHQRGIQLQLSGHTHDGQLWPFRFLVRLQTRFLAGIYRIGDSALYVSRGTGFWGPPMRVLSPPEITELCLRSA